MLAPIIPIDSLDRAIAQIVWRLPLEQTAELESMYSMDPAARIRKLMEIVTIAAKRDPKVVEVLRTPTVLPALKQMALERQSEQAADPQGEQVRAG